MGWVPILRPLVCSTRTFRHLSFAEGNARRTRFCSKLRRHVAECPGDPRRLVERGARPGSRSQSALHRPGGDGRRPLSSRRGAARFRPVSAFVSPPCFRFRRAAFPGNERVPPSPPLCTGVSVGVWGSQSK